MRSTIADTLNLVVCKFKETEICFDHGMIDDTDELIGWMDKTLRKERK